MTSRRDQALSSLLGDLLRIRPGMEARVEKSLYISTEDKDDIMADYQKIIDRINDALNRSSGSAPLSKGEKRRRDAFQFHFLNKDD